MSNPIRSLPEEIDNCILDQPESELGFLVSARHCRGYDLFLSFFRAAAHRFRWAAAIRLRASGERFRLRVAGDDACFFATALVPGSVPPNIPPISSMFC